MPGKKNKPVSRILCSVHKTVSNHSSRRFVTKPLERPTRKRFPKCFGKFSGQLKFACPYLVLHHEEFTQPRLLPAAPVRSYRTISPITNSKSNWLVCFLLHLSSFSLKKTPGRYPARRPSVFGLSSFIFTKSDCSTYSFCSA